MTDLIQLYQWFLGVFADIFTHSNPLKCYPFCQTCGQVNPELIAGDKIQTTLMCKNDSCQVMMGVF